ncbi:MAG TPA: DNA polymerase I [Pirellulales bacterium]|nr:DNA polymerase I [Pirellulales bacterium]
MIDSFSLIFQVFHALPEMTNAKGEPVAAVFGFVKDILSLLENRQPDYLFCAYDMPGPTFRDQLVADYKAHRTEMPVDLAPQLGTIRRILDAMGVPVLGVSGYEADDVLATVARVTTEQGGNCILVTGDKDCRQLLSDQVQIFNIRKNTLFDVAALQADWGVTPEQVVDYQALVGDSVDNIKGVPGIGKKTAPELLQHYGSLDALLAAADKIEKKKLRENLIAGREQALLSRELARLNVHTPLNIPWSGGAKANLHPGGAVEHFRECGFRTLAAKWATAPAERLLLTPQETPLEIVTDPLALVAAVEKIRRAGTFSVQVILSHRYARWAEIIGCAILTADNIGYYFALRGDNSDALDPVEALAALRSLFEDEKILKSGHDLKATVIALKNQGIALRGIAFDTLLAGYLLDAGERGHSLAELAKRHLDETAPEDPSPSKALAARFAQVPLAILARYAIETTALIRRLQPILSERMDQAGLTPLFSDVEMPLLEILAELEFLGMKIDVDRLEILSSNYRIRLEELEREIHQDAGGAFNIASPKQLADVLFTRLKLPVVKKTKTGPSTDAEVLEELAKLHPLPARIVEYRQFAKLKNTYVDALPQLVHPVTRRVHASLNQAVAATGRLSGSDPNLQNIPVRTHSGREIRAAFLPGVAGWQLLAADYSQIELRVLAHFSQDAALLAAFARDEDIHTRVASEVFGVAPEGVDADMRRTAKAVNFGVIYGQSPFGLAKALGISQEEAARFIDAYFNGYAGVERFLTQLLADCFRDGFVSTLLGRRRAIRGIRQPDPLAAGAASRNRNLPEREAINTVIQGSAADLIKLAMIHIERRLRRENRQAKLLLQIHDELILEVPPDELPAVGRLVAEEMAQAYPLSVPLKVDLKSGANWAECEPWT